MCAITRSSVQIEIPFRQEINVSFKTFSLFILHYFNVLNYGVYENS